MSHGLLWSFLLLSLPNCVFVITHAALADNHRLRGLLASTSEDYNEIPCDNGNTVRVKQRQRRAVQESILIVDYNHSKLEGRRLHRYAAGFPVMVTYKNLNGRDNIIKNMKSQGPDFEVISTIAGVLPDIDTLASLLNDPDIDMISEDHVVYSVGETIPYGVKLSQYKDTSTTSSSGSSGSCDGNSLRVAIVDGGMDVHHPDLPCYTEGASGKNCMGTEFGMTNSDATWDSPSYFHGTHVAGTMFAVHHNNVGTFGLAGGENLCIMIARVLDDNGAAFMSSILQGVIWAVQHGAQIINLSIAGGGYVQSTNAQFDYLYKRGILIFAASGNEGGTDFSYPASYDGVISVSAVGETKNAAWFSQSNNKVDLAAPGVQILSTAPIGHGNYVATVVASSLTVTGAWVSGSSRPSGSRTATLVVCSNNGQQVCPGPGGHICIIKSGIISIDTQAMHCQSGGGAAAILYLSQLGQRLSGKLNSNTNVRIPVAIIGVKDGNALVNSHNRQSVTLRATDGYMFSDGTSMAAPHASGTAAALWRACRLCSNFQIERCMYNTAQDLGATGYDPVYGHGLIQMRSAFSCLKDTCC